MKDEIKKRVTEMLDHFLAAHNCRKTPERYAILEAVYSQSGPFSLEELGDQLEQHNFRVSRATLYNTMRLFQECRLVVRHHFLDGTKYEASFQNENRLRQICTVCGKVTKVVSPQIVSAIEETKLRRFRRDGFSLYIYGVCSSCQAQITRKLRLEQKERSKKQR